MEICPSSTASGGVQLVVTDDGPPERRSAVLEALAERASTLNARFTSEVRSARLDDPHRGASLGSATLGDRLVVDVVLRSAYVYLRVPI